MDKAIWKYKVPFENRVEVLMPEGAEIIEAAITTPSAIGFYPEIHVWAIVDTDAPHVERRFEIRGTGHPLGNVGRHIKTMQDGMFVWHLFEAADS